MKGLRDTNMTKAENERTQEEFDAVLDWSSKEKQELIEKLKKEGRWQGGLGYDSVFEKINKETAKRIERLRKMNQSESSIK